MLLVSVPIMYTVSMAAKTYAYTYHLLGVSQDSQNSATRHFLDIYPVITLQLSSRIKVIKWIGFEASDSGWLKCPHATVSKG